MQLRDVKRDYVKRYNEVKKRNQDRNYGYIEDHQIFYIPFKFYVDMSNRSYEERNSVKNYEDISLHTVDYFPAKNLTICVEGSSTNNVMVSHYFLLNDKREFTCTLGSEDEIEMGIHSERDKEKYMGNVLLCIMFSLNMKESLVGTESITMRKKSGQSVVTPITYISNKKYSNAQKNTRGEPIDWKHSWEVIGHWRVCSTIGKGRDGEYNQINRTWVNPSVRGKGDLVKKLRVIKGGNYDL